MVHQSARLSSKALGKRPMRNGLPTTPSTLSALTPSADSALADDETDDGSLEPSAGNTRTRLNHKRVLPSRMRRGGVNSLVGTNDIDVNILDTLQRRGENDPLIPARTVFILTTDSSQVPSGSTSEIGLNNVAYERYFERPEVIKAYKAQQNIQVPEFSQLDEELVGGRLRARTGEVECFELSDAAYEKRHRKHEILEKRQRLREKEQLQHEHYKLKERIEQLRTLDPNAFLALSHDIFGPLEGQTSADLPNGAEACISTADTLHEAERRRRLMLDVATSLEERYRTLLPTEKKHVEPRHVTRRASASVEPSLPDEVTDSTADQDTASTVSRHKQTKLKSILRGSAQPTPPPLLATESSRRRRDASLPRKSPSPSPEHVPEEDTVIVSAPHWLSSRQTRARAGQRSESVPHVERSIVQTQNLADTASDPFTSTFTNRNSHISSSHPEYNLSYGRSGSLDVTPRVNCEGKIPIPITHETSFQETTNTRSSRRSVTRAESPLDVIHYIPPTTQGPARKKKKTVHPSTDQTHSTPDRIITQVSEVPDSLTNFSPTVSTKSAQVEDNVLTVNPTTPQPDQNLSEPSEAEMVMPDAFTGPVGSVTEPSNASSLTLNDRTVPFAQLRQLARPDHDGEFDTSEQAEINETPTADEPVTPPVGPETATDTLIAEGHKTFLVPTTLEPINKKRRRQSTPYPRRETSMSLPPELLASASLPVISSQSYEIPTITGKGRKPKPLGSLLAASKYNVEPGRKTGRSVKAFGVEVPHSEDGKFVEFKLPQSIIRGVLADGWADNMSDGESDGDPPSFTAGMAHGEAQHNTHYESISAARPVGRDGFD